MPSVIGRLRLHLLLVRAVDKKLAFFKIDFLFIGYFYTEAIEKDFEGEHHHIFRYILTINCSLEYLSAGNYK
jgi:hypothetical protein